MAAVDGFGYGIDLLVQLPEQALFQCLVFCEGGNLRAFGEFLVQVNLMPGRQIDRLVNAARLRNNNSQQFLELLHSLPSFINAKR